jgi:hypothetical protein
LSWFHSKTYSRFYEILEKLGGDQLTKSWKSTKSWKKSLWGNSKILYLSRFFEKDFQK